MTMVSLFANLPDSFIRHVELGVQLAQGKGWGSTTVHAEVKSCLALAHAQGLKEICALDIGANGGLWTLALMAQSPDATVHAFEPSAVAFELLKNAVSKFQTVHIYQLGIGHTHGKANLYFDTPGSGLGSLTRRRLEHFDIDFSGMEIIELSTLDIWSERTKRESIQPNILKMDVEGHEMDVLLGATSLLPSIKVIQFEFGGSNIDSRTYFQDFWYFLKEKNFDIYRLGPSGLHPIEKYSERDETFVTTNFFAMRSL